MHRSLLADWSPEEFHTLERGVLVAKHRLAETGLFTDEGLARILDTHPDHAMTISTMGSDANKFEWWEGDRNGVPGDVLLETVKCGKLWINCRNMLTHHKEVRDAVMSIYDELEANSPGFQARDRSANLLISSPNAMVHYHLDIPVNMLWHLRGEKRIWVYPHFDHRFVAQHVIEKVCSGEYSEDIPYDLSFDKYALVFDAQPGELITWPQHTPHRVTNLDGLNVSLSTEHKNPRATRRINVHLANQFLRRTLRISCKDTSPDGWSAHVKESIIRAVRWTRRCLRQQPTQFTYPKCFRVDPLAPLGFTQFDPQAETFVAPHELETVR